MSFSIHAIDKDAVIDDDGLTLAVIRLNSHNQIEVCWLPEMFMTGEIPPGTRAAIVERLRADADRLESKELDARMRSVVSRIRKTGES